MERKISLHVSRDKTSICKHSLNRYASIAAHTIVVPLVQNALYFRHKRAEQLWSIRRMYSVRITGAREGPAPTAIVGL